MAYMESLADILNNRSTSAQAAQTAFDSLEAVDLDFMWGRWKGYEIKTGHHLDGLLEPTGWYGKLFSSSEEVHPLLFYTRNQSALYAVNPSLVPLHISFPKSDILGPLMRAARPFLQTRKSRARLRLMDFRGKHTATMCYDDKPIFDHFARVDDHTVLGIMDLKNVPEPYVFVLERDDHSSFQLLF